jgi:hypothetical protein
VTVLLAAVVGRVLREFPQANARLVGHRLVPRERVALALPVDRRDRGAGQGVETAMAVVNDAAARTLVDLASECRSAVEAERQGRSRLRWVRWLITLADRTPMVLLEPAFDAIDRIGRLPAVAHRLYGDLPGAALTNVGAVLGSAEGIIFRAASWALPQRLMHVGTVWGVSAVQDEVVAVDGAPTVRPMLPVVLCFDHRLFDGALAGRLLLRFGEILRDPETVFGVDGSRMPA